MGGWGRLVGWLGRGGRVLLLGCLAAGQGSAATRDIGCSPAGGEVVDVVAVDADLGLTLEDGRIVLLAGLDPVRPTPLRPDAAEAARIRLADWLVGQPATLQPLDTAPDRWGRTRALVFASTAPRGEPGAPAPLSVALALVDAGMARGRPDAALHACWSATLAAELGARAAGLGLWGDPYYAVRAVGDAPSLADLPGRFVLVQGRVTRVAQGRSRLFVDLGPRSANVSLRLAGNASFILGQLGLSEDRLLGRNLRVRGVLDDRFGYTVDVNDRDQVEVLGDATPERPRTARDGPR